MPLSVSSHGNASGKSRVVIENLFHSLLISLHPCNFWHCGLSAVQGRGGGGGCR